MLLVQVLQGLGPVLLLETTGAGAVQVALVVRGRSRAGGAAVQVVPARGAARWCRLHVLPPSLFSQRRICYVVPCSSLNMSAVGPTTRLGEDLYLGWIRQCQPFRLVRSLNWRTSGKMASLTL